MKVDAFFIPSAQAAIGEGVTQIIWSRSNPSSFWLQTGRLEEKSEGAGGGFDWKGALVNANEKARIWVGLRESHTGAKVSVQFSGEGTMKWNPS